jgi:glycyl-tRNA synthetase beta chain
LKDYLLPSYKYQPFISYKRFGIVINNIDPNQNIIKKIKGPAISQGGNSPALIGFCKKYNITNLSELIKEKDGYYYIVINANSGNFAYQLTQYLLLALKNMVNNVMTWQDYQFIRPIRNLVVMLNETVLPVTIFGCQSNNKTLLGKYINVNNMVDYQTALISSANNYFDIMAQYYVYPSFEIRKFKIKQELEFYCSQHDLTIANDVPSSLLDEVTGLVESPLVLLGEFDREFLSIPSGVLILTMAKNQKYFALSSKQNIQQLDNKFLLVADISYALINHAREKLSQDQLNDMQCAALKQKIIADNEQVLTARLIDAKFFYEHDLAIAWQWFNNKYPQIQNNLHLILQKLEESGAIFEYYNEKLKHQVYNAKLGELASQWHRMQRIKKIAVQIALNCQSNLKDNVQQVKIAAELSKFDLTTAMVTEFTQLQGYIGAKYYDDFITNLLKKFQDNYSELNDLNNLPAEYRKYVDHNISNAISCQYLLSNDLVHTNNNFVALLLILVNNLEHILSMWIVGNIPTSEKDPYGVRRAAKNVLAVLAAVDQSASFMTPILLLDLNMIWHLISADVLQLYNIDQMKYQQIIEQINSFILQRYKMNFKNDDSADIASHIINKIEQYGCKNLQFAQHNSIIVTLYRLSTTQALTYKQILKRVNSLLESKPEFLASCRQLIDIFEQTWYLHNSNLDRAIIELYKLQATDRNFIISYSANQIKQQSVLALKDAILNISEQNFVLLYLENDTIMTLLIPLINKFLDDVMVFDQNDCNSQLYQTILKVAYTTVNLFDLF